MTRADPPKPRPILLGEITGVHGIRGDVVVRSYAAAPEDIAAYGLLDDEGGRRAITLAVVRVTAKGVVARVAGVNDRSAAEKLKGVKLYVDRARLPEAENGAYYHYDLIGLAAVDPDGAPIGEIVAVHNFGAGDILEVRLAGGRSSELLPFTDAVVPEVDIRAGRVVIAMPVDDDQR